MRLVSNNFSILLEAFPLCTLTGRISPLLLLSLLTACSTSAPSTPVPNSPLKTYFGPAVSTNLNVSTFAIDRSLNSFLQYRSPTNIANSGSFTALPNGILNIGVTFGGPQGIVYSPAQSGNWAVEWPGQIGLVGLSGQPVTPIIPNENCPALPTTATYRFVTLPLAGDSTGIAFGSASISTAGTAVNFSNISQFNISGGAAANPSPASVTATCAPTFYGKTISAPNYSTVTNPGSGQTTTPSATIAIGPTGFLVEDNGYTPNPATYQNILGAGTGAIGLPAPSPALTASALTAAQYTGFIYGTGAAGNAIKNLTAVPSSTRVASFGFPNVGTSCPQPPTAAGSTIIFGGEFSSNNPAANPFGNCDVAVDLGAQDAANNGLFPAATISLGAAFPGNTTGKTYSFSAVAIAGQVQGKFAVFLIGLDRAGLQVVSQGQQTQDWGLYLLQSN